MTYHASIKKNKADPHVLTWINIQDTLLGEREKKAGAKQAVYSLLPFVNKSNKHIPTHIHTNIHIPVCFCKKNSRRINKKLIEMATYMG